MKEIEITREQVLSAFGDKETIVEVMPASSSRWEVLSASQVTRLNAALEFGAPIRVFYHKELTYGYYQRRLEIDIPECDGDCKNCKRK